MERMTKTSQITIGILILVIAGMLAVGLFFWKALVPYSNARTEAIKVARQQTDIKTVTAFDIATSDETTYSVEGKDASGQKIAVLIPKKSSEISVVDLDKGTSPDKLTEKDTKSVVLGLYKGKAVWEVNNQSGFKLYDFSSGKEVL